TALGNQGSVLFEVWGDDELLFSSDVITGADSTEVINLDIVSINELRLVTHNNGSSNNADDSHMDYGVWADAAVTCNAPQVPAWTFCANEGELCEFTGTRQVRFGASGQFIILTLAAESGG